MTDLQLARQLYHAYNDQGPNPWKNFAGGIVPSFDECGEQVRGKWVAVAIASRQLVPGMGLHKHYKTGGTYSVTGYRVSSGNATDGVRMVDYVSLVDGVPRNRPETEFFELVVWADGIVRPRFARLPLEKPEGSSGKPTKELAAPVDPGLNECG